MSLLLNIDTALDTACISIAKDGIILEQAQNTDQKDHGTFLQNAVSILLEKAVISINDLDAVAVVNGPGSYTGLRVGMASAKGICYAINKPLITVGTLELMATQAIEETKDVKNETPLLFCPMIDARRMEVFTAVYDGNLQAVLAPCAMVLNAESYAKILLNNNILFFGNGSKKWLDLTDHHNVLHKTFITNSLYMSKISYKLFCLKTFSDIAYAEPLYIKEFYNTFI